MEQTTPSPQKKSQANKEKPRLSPFSIPIGFGFRTNIFGLICLVLLVYLTITAVIHCDWINLGLLWLVVIVIWGLPAYWQYKTRDKGFHWSRPEATMQRLLQHLENDPGSLGLTPAQKEMLKFYSTHDKDGWPYPQWDEHAAHLHSRDKADFTWQSQGAENRLKAIKELQERGWLQVKETRPGVADLLQLKDPLAEATLLRLDLKHAAQELDKCSTR